MATISLTIPDGVLPRLIDAVAIKFNYDVNKLNGETKAQFAKRMLAVTLKQWVKDGERPSIVSAFQSQATANDTDIDNTVDIS